MSIDIAKTILINTNKGILEKYDELISKKEQNVEIQSQALQLYSIYSDINKAIAELDEPETDHIND